MDQEAFQLLAINIPTEPGIYKYFDSRKELLYVGKTKNLHKRVSSYFNKTLSNYKTYELSDVFIP
jgi:excinuclease ABC subunit C